MQIEVRIYVLNSSMYVAQINCATYIGLTPISLYKMVFMLLVETICIKTTSNSPAGCCGYKSNVHIAAVKPRASRSDV